MKNTIVKLLGRFRTASTWTGLFAVIGILATEVCGTQLPAEWDTFITLFLSLLYALGVVSDSANGTPFTWQSFKKAITSRVSISAMIALAVFILRDWLGLSGGAWETVLGVLTAALGVFGAANNPTTREEF